MRSDLLKKLFQAYAENDNKKFSLIAYEIINEEEKQNHKILASDLKKLLSSNQQTIINLNRNLNSNQLSGRYKTNIPIPRDTEKGFPLLEIKDNYYNFDDIVLDNQLKDRISYIIDEFRAKKLLNTYGLKPKNKILFCGPPGTGKTLCAKVISSTLNYPLVYVRFDSIVSSFLGQTATNLRKIFDFVENGEWVVLFDEFDIVGKKRDDPYEHGEIKRVVNNFMQMLDGYDGQSLIIAATNHQYLLDTAIWRRFDDILYFDMPDKIRKEQLFNKYLRVIKKSKDINIEKLVTLSNNFSPADIAQICEEARKKSHYKKSKRS